MPIRSNIVNTNIFYYLKGKIAIYVMNFIKLNGMKTFCDVICVSMLVTNQIASFQRIVV